MKTKLIAILGILALLAALLPTAALAAKKTPDYRPVEISSEVRSWEATPAHIAPLDKAKLAKKEAAANARVAASTKDCITDAKIFLALDNINGYFFDTFYLMADSSNSQIWVQADLSWPNGDPRKTPAVDCDQAAYMAGQFDTNIFPTETTFFGPPDFHDGTSSLLVSWGYFPSGYYDDVNGRQIVLVENVKDENYYDPTYPNYIAGFYSSTLEGYFDRNTMTIDAYDWKNRIGPDAKRPYLYEGVFAHEYEHLLHADYDPNEENWINEGLADWAMDLVGYGVSLSHLEELVNNPENSLVVWGDQGGLEILADYGIAYLYQENMFEKYGQDFIYNEFHNTNQGIASVDEVLTGLGSGETFADTFHEFAVSTYTKGAFTHEQLMDFQIDVGHPGKRNPGAYATEGAPPWGSDYYLLWGYKRIANFQFNGFQFNPLSWKSDGEVLWGGEGDLIDNWAIFGTTAGNTLSFDTSYEIEQSWDFGFVQVSTDGGVNWTSLSNAFTTSSIDPNGHPNIAANLPGLTGSSGGWVNMSFDTSAYAGQNVLFAFRYMTDWAYNEAGWYLDNVYVDETLISDGSSTDAFMNLNQVLGISNEYTVQLIGERIRNGEPEYEVKTILTGGYVSNWVSIRKMFRKYRRLIMVVTYDAPQGVSDYASYDFEISKKGGKHIK